MAKSTYSIGQERAQALSNCPKCGYKLSKFRIAARCFNCDYKVRGSGGPWAAGVPDQNLIDDAERVWDHAHIVR
jgi:hypothetical protein